MHKQYLVNFLKGIYLLLVLSLAPCLNQALEASEFPLTFSELDRSHVAEIYTGKGREVRQSYSKLVSSKEPFLRYLRWLFLEQGLTFPCLIYPVTLEEVRYLMRTHLDRQSLSRRARKLYDLIWEKTEQPALLGRAGKIAIDPVIGLNSEFYIGCLSKSSREWYLHPYAVRPAFIDLGAEVSLGNKLYINTTAHISQDPVWIDMHPNSFSGNIITNFSSIYALMPQEAYASLYIPHLNLQGGRGYLQWGNAYSGSLILDATVGELDYLQISTWWEFVRFSSLWVFLDYSLPMRDKKTGKIVYYQAGVKKYAYAIAPEDLACMGGIPSQFFLAHRLDFNLGQTMNLSISEAIIYKDYWKNMAFLNPLYFFNNWHLGDKAHYCFCLEAQLLLYPGWKIYTQILLERLAHPCSVEKDDKSSLPILAGLEVCKNWGMGHLAWVFEFVKLDPYSYVGKEGVGFYFDRRWLSSYSGACLGQNGYTLLRRVPMGYAMGTDLVRFFMLLRYEVPESYSFWIQYSHLFKGKNSLETAYIDHSGAKSYKQILVSLGSDVSLTPYIKDINLLLKADITLGASILEKHTDWDVQLGLGVNYWY